MIHCLNQIQVNLAISKPAWEVLDRGKNVELKKYNNRSGWQVDWNKPTMENEFLCVS